MKLEPLGNRVIILPDKGVNDEGEKVTDWGFVEQTSSQVDADRDQVSVGTIVAFGPSAWLDPVLGGEPWVEVGDKVVFAKYSGKAIKDPEDDKIEYMIVNDDAIQVRIEK